MNKQKQERKSSECYIWSKEEAGNPWSVWVSFCLLEQFIVHQFWSLFWTSDILSSDQSDWSQWKRDKNPTSRLPRTFASWSTNLPGERFGDDSLIKSVFCRWKPGTSGDWWIIIITQRVPCRTWTIKETEWIIQLHFVSVCKKLSHRNMWCDACDVMWFLHSRSLCFWWMWTCSVFSWAQHYEFCETNDSLFVQRPSWGNSDTKRRFSTPHISPVLCRNCQVSDTDIKTRFPNVLREPMTRDQMVSVSPIWQLGHVGKGADVFAKPQFSHTAMTSALVRRFVQRTLHWKSKFPLTFVQWARWLQWGSQPLVLAPNQLSLGIRSCAQ